MTDPLLRLRAQAQWEEIARKTQDRDLTPEDARTILHELQIHQIELEMQNEELQQAQLALEVTKARYFDLFELAPVGYITVSEAGLILECNLTAASMIGVPRGGLIKKAFSQLIIKEDQDAWYLLRKKVVATHQQINAEMRIACGNGSQLWCMFGAANVEDELGVMTMRLAVFDITDQKQAHSRLQQKTTALKAISQGVIITTPDFLIVTANAAFLTITGYSEAEVLGRNCRFLQGPDTDSHAVEAIRAALQQRAEFAGDILNYRRGGVPFWNALTISPVFDTHGSLTHFVGVTRDITESVAAQAALRESDAFVRTVMECVPGMLAYWSRDLVCRFSNQAYLAWFGRTPEEMAGIEMKTLFGEALFHANEPFVRAVLSGEDQQFERELTTPSGDTRYTLAHYVAHRKDGKVVGFLASVTDISEVKKTQLSLGLSLNEQKALLKEVHHRVKNNLQVIASLLRLEAGRSTVADTKSVLGDMNGRIHAMAQLHESLYRSGTLASIDFGSYLSQLATQVFRTQGTHSGLVQLKHDTGTVQVGMDQATVGGLLLNELITNCIKHGFPEGRSGEIRVRLQPVAQGQGSDAKWSLSVSDTGIGLPADFKEKRNTSLGLQLVGDLSTQLGGTLTIDSAPDRGAKFEVVFTVQEPAALVMPG